MKNNIITQSIPGGFSVIASSFIAQSLEHMIPWLIVTFSVRCMRFDVRDKEMLAIG